jgi:hypothetical protein
MCDRIQDGDERNLKMKAMLNMSEEKYKCVEINVDLEKCLNGNNRDFRKCKDFVMQLKECMNTNNANYNNK